MRNLILSIAIVAALAVSAFADGALRVAKPLPSVAHGTNAVVAVKFATQRAVKPLAFDVYGSTVSSGTVTAYQLRQYGSTVETNTLFSAAAPASTNAFTVATPRGFCFGNEPIYFKFTLAAGGYLVVYGETKE